jgi:spore coat polysaccharide biosynthesis predicted glycosyltransferase SpsG
MFWGVRPRDTAPTVRRVLVTVGGSAITGGATLAASVAQAVPDAEVHFVVGPYAEEAPEDGVRLVRAPSDLLDELLRADVVVSAAGQTMLEAACTGTPCVAVALAGNQRLQLAALQTAGAVVAATSDNAAATVATLAADAPRRAALAARSRTVVDGFGALRLAWRLRDLVRMPEQPQSAVPGGRRR